MRQSGNISVVQLFDECFKLARSVDWLAPDRLSRSDNQLRLRDVLLFNASHNFLRSSRRRRKPALSPCLSALSADRVTSDSCSTFDALNPKEASFGLGLNCARA